MNQEEESNKRLDTIINSNARRLLVCAGPGTGKTTALIKRVKRLLDDGIKPEEILVLTFSRAAAADLKKKLEKLHGDILCPKVKANTVHAYCLKFLNKKASEKADPKPRLLFKYEEKFLLEDLKNKELSRSRTRKKISSAEQKRILTKQEKLLKKFKAALARFTREEEEFSPIRDWLVFHNAMLIEEVVPRAFCYLENSSYTSRPRFAHILVDEYQDLNNAEQKFLDLLAKDSNFTVVGDKNQSIYSFRQALPEGISKFKERNFDTEVVKLEICRRCPSKIVDMANKLISPKKPVLMVRRKNGPGEVFILTSKNLEKEAEKLATFIKFKVDSGKESPKEILILARTQVLVSELLKAFKNNGVKAHSFFPIEEEYNPSETAKSEKEQIYTLLTLAANKQDKVALRCWCGFGHEELQAGLWGEIKRECSGGRKLCDVLEEVRTERLQLTRELIQNESVQQLIKRLNDLKGKLQELGGLREKKEFLDFLFPVENPNHKSIRTIFDSLEPEAGATELLKTLHNNFLSPEIQAAPDSVSVMSLHKSKGLTANLVIIVGFVDGQIPYNKGDEELKEERRLFYMLITRASRILILSMVNKLPNECRSGRRNEKKTFKTRKSPFIRELGETTPPEVHCLSPSKGP